MLIAHVDDRERAFGVTDRANIDVNKSISLLRTFIGPEGLIDSCTS